MQLPRSLLKVYAFMLIQFTIFVSNNSSRGRGRGRRAVVVDSQSNQEYTFSKPWLFLLSSTPSPSIFIARFRRLIWMLKTRNTKRHSAERQKHLNISSFVYVFTQHTNNIILTRTKERMKFLFYKKKKTMKGEKVRNWHEQKFKKKKRKKKKK